MITKRNPTAVYKKLLFRLNPYNNKNAKYEIKIEEIGIKNEIDIFKKNKIEVNIKHKQGNIASNHPVEKIIS